MSAPFSIEPTFAEKKRRQVRDAAALMGIDRAYLSLMVEDFYERVRADPRLGPIFVAELGEDWSAHLLRMKRFWTAIVLVDGSYTGKPVAVHQRLRGVEPEDFAIWLDLFRTTLEETAPTQEAVNHLMFRARRIAQSLAMAMFSQTAEGVPALQMDI